MLEASATVGPTLFSFGRILRAFLLATAVTAVACGDDTDPSEPGATPTESVSTCPVEQELCLFADEVVGWVANGNVDAIVQGSIFSNTSGRSSVIGAIASGLGQSAHPRNATVACPIVAGESACDRGFVLALTTIEQGETDSGWGQLLLMGFARDDSPAPALTGVGLVELPGTRSAALAGGLVIDCTIPVGLQPASQDEECLPLDFKAR